MGPDRYLRRAGDLLAGLGGAQQITAMVRVSWTRKALSTAAIGLTALVWIALWHTTVPRN